ncbi:ribonuclease H-like domain-containing protein [Tanacetum coccineum]
MPQISCAGIDVKEPYTILYKPRGVVYLNKSNRKYLMRSDELYKFSDGTLKSVCDTLDPMLKNFVLGYNNEGMPNRAWSEKEQKRTTSILKKIDDTLLKRRIMRSLEGFVGGRHVGPHGTKEVEYRGVANAVAETCWLRNLLRELHTPLSFATLVYCDNVSVVYLSSNPVQHQRMKHIEIDIHFVGDLVAAGQVRVLYVPSRYHYADIFTKGLPYVLFEEFRASLSVKYPPAQTAGKC